MVAGVPSRLFTVEEYHRMGDAGVFGPDERVELIDGEIVRMAPIGDQHAAAVMRLSRILFRLDERLVSISVHNPVRIAPDSDPEPDFALLAPKEYDRAPTADEVLVIIEVADTSPVYDRGVKRRLYARAGIGEYWIVDVQGGGIERYTLPDAGEYRDVVRAGRGETLGSTVLPQLRLMVDDVLPPPPATADGSVRGGEVAMVAGVASRLFTAKEYHRMAEAGVFRPDERVELIDGEIIRMVPIGDPHVGVVIRMNELLVRMLVGRARVSVQNPVRLSLDSEPEPDFALLIPQEYDRAPRADEVLAVIEVAEKSLR